MGHHYAGGEGDRGGCRRRTGGSGSIGVVASGSNAQPVTVIVSEPHVGVSRTCRSAGPREMAGQRRASARALARFRAPTLSLADARPVQARPGVHVDIEAMVRAVGQVHVRDIGLSTAYR